MFVSLRQISHRTALIGLTLAAVTSSATAAAPDFKGTAISFMQKHCYECHGGKTTKAGLDLTKHKDTANFLKEHKHWKGVLHQVNSGEMPPKKKQPQPTPAEITAFNAAIT